MSYLNYPRLHFSGSFRAAPSTINNIASNYNPAVYPSISELENAALVWNPKGDGGFDLKDCVVTQVDYSDGTSATSSAEDPIIGQPISAVEAPNWPLPATIVDLDPDQQGVSELWALTIKIGGSDYSVTGDYVAAAFSSMWQQSQEDLTGGNRGSALFSAVYQSSLTNLQSSGDISQSRLLSELNSGEGQKLSINFVVNQHNNSPQQYLFNGDTFQEMTKLGVSQAIQDKIAPMKQMNQLPDKQGPPGLIPTQSFVVFAVNQYLSQEEANNNIENIINATKQSNFENITPYDFTYGHVKGTVGNSEPEAPNFFVASRMMAPTSNVPFHAPGQFGTATYFVPFLVSDNGNEVILNFGNSLATDKPGGAFVSQLGTDLKLVAFESGSTSTYRELTSIPITDQGFLSDGSGFFMYQAGTGEDFSSTPLGVVAVAADGSKSVLLAENMQGYYLCADKYVFRMNPGVSTTPQTPRGDTADVNIHVLQWGKPVADGTEIKLVNQPNAFGPNTGTPASALTIAPASGIATTQNGVANFSLSASDPKNPRHFINGQVYSLAYTFNDSTISSGYTYNSTDSVSVHVYDKVAAGQGSETLNKYGRLYLIMSFLADNNQFKQMSLRNIIKQYLELPYTDPVHMPVTRDLSEADRTQIVAWIESLNQAPPPTT